MDLLSSILIDDKLVLYSNNLAIIDIAISPGFLLVIFFKPTGHSILFIRFEL